MASASSAPPVAVVCIGMAGSGKTTFMQRINAHLHAQKRTPYIVNLDPAVRSVPFDSNIDIRDSVNYKEVMKQYNLGPNGGILTSLNLFATKVDQVLGILEKRTMRGEAESQQSQQQQQQQQDAGSKQLPPPIEHILVDTPGQIEVFVWSASGDILLGSLASSFPTVVAYIIDTPRTASTSTFMSNMLYACSILYKTKLPMILVFNKTDVRDAEFAREWMTDFDAFQTALQEEEQNGVFGGESGPGGSGYMSSLLNSMSLVLEEFYRHLNVVGVSAMTGAGVDEFFEAVKEKAAEFERDYKPELDRRRKQREEDKEAKREQELGKLLKDMNVSAESSSAASGARKGPTSRPKEEPETISDIEDESDEDSGAIVEPDEAELKDADDDMSQRYQQALKDDKGSGNFKDEDFSFARYIRSANIG